MIKILRVTADNVSQQRTIRPLYAQHQATPYAAFLHASWDRSVDILPGMVMTKLDSENVSLFGTIGGTGSVVASHEVFGLAGLFVAPVLGIDEVRDVGLNVFPVWIGGNQAVFEVLAPAFDTTATYTDITTGAKTPLRVTLSGHAQGAGKLTTAASGANVSVKVAAYLIDVVSATKIIVSLEKPGSATGGSTL